MIYDTSHLHDDARDGDDDGASNCGFDDFDDEPLDTCPARKKSATLSISSSCSSTASRDATSASCDGSDEEGNDPKHCRTPQSSCSSTRSGSATRRRTGARPSCQQCDATIGELQQEALFLLERFQRYYAAHSATVSGLGKLLTRFEKEVILANEASNVALRHECVALTAAERHQEGGDDDVAAASEPSYLQCNCLRLLELVLHVLENEADVIAVVHPIKPRVLARSAARPSGTMLPETPFDVDVISCGGLRWIKVKGTSSRNLDAEIFSSSSSGYERRSLPSILRNMASGARCTRLPFGLRPHISLVFFYRPSRAAMRVLVEETKATLDLVGGISGEKGRGGQEEVRSRASALNGRSPGLFSVHIYEDVLRTQNFSHSDTSEEAKESPTRGDTSPPSHDQHDTTVVSLRERFHPRLTPSLWSRFLPKLSYPIVLVNFDVTALVALVSDTCNGWAGSPIPGHPILNEQSQAELTCAAVRDFIEPVLEQHTRRLESLGSLHALLNQAVFSPRRIPEMTDDDGQEVCDTLVDETPRVDADIVRGFSLDDENCAHLLLDPLAAVAEDGFRSVTSTSLSFTSTSRYLRPALPDDTTSESAVAPYRCNWIVSDVALAEFTWILSTIAGPCEYQRAVALLRRMYVVSSSCVEDLVLRGGSGSEASAVVKMQCTGKITQRHKDVFGLGDCLHAITLSANRQFSQAARDQGVEILMAMHPSRALTERKRLCSDRMSGPKKPPTTTQFRKGPQPAHKVSQ